MTERWLALDRLRALAIVLMVQGHTFSALLEPGAMAPAVERLHSLIHGLTAPMFLVGAGLAFGVTSYPRYSVQRLDRALLKVRLRRCAVLMLVGYALQLPGGSPLAALRLAGAERALLWRVGPLHLIALILCLSQLSMRAIRAPRLQACALSALGLLIAAASPAVWKSGLSAQLGVELGSWLDDRYGSHFSIFPWASFVLLGVGLGALVTSSRIRARGLAFVAVGGALAALAYGLFALDLAGYEPRWFWFTNPCYVAFRLGLVLLILGALHRRGDRAAHGSRAAVRPGFAATLTRHSLAAYVTHLLLLYGTPLTPNLAHRFAGQLSLTETCLVCGGVMLLTLALAFVLELRERPLAKAAEHAVRQPASERPEHVAQALRS